MSSQTKSEPEWRTQLSPQAFKVLRQKVSTHLTLASPCLAPHTIWQGTEAPGTGEYDKLDAPGVYNCGGCGTPLYTSGTKFKSGCGWPAFFDAIPGAINRHEDKSMFTTRTEVCALSHPI